MGLILLSQMVICNDNNDQHEKPKEDKHSGIVEDLKHVIKEIRNEHGLTHSSNDTPPTKD